MHRCPNRALSVARAGDADQLGHRRDGHRGRRRAVRAAALVGGPAALDARPLPAHARAAGGARRLRRDLGRERGRRDRALEATAVLARPLRAQHPRRRLGDRAQPRAALRRRRPRCSTPARRRSRRSRASARTAPRRSPSGSRTSRTGRSSPSCASSACASRWGRGAAGRGAARQAAHYVITGTLEAFSREEAAAALGGAGRQGLGQRLEEDDRRHRRREPGLEGREGGEGRRAAADGGRPEAARRGRAALGDDGDAAAAPPPLAASGHGLQITSAIGRARSLKRPSERSVAGAHAARPRTRRGARRRGAER